ncbi:MAG: MotA/TolQ/ExbB proton channel family protein [Bacteroidota bacterium]
MRISVANILGVLISLGLIVFGVMEVTGSSDLINRWLGSSGSRFLNIPSLAIVLGGVMNAVFITYQPKYIGKAFLSVFLIFNHSKTNNKRLKQDLVKILEWNELIKSNRVKSLNSLAEEHAKEVSGFLFSLLSTNYTQEEIESFGTVNVEEHFYRKMVIVDVLKAMGASAPAFGMFGTLFGLIVMLGKLEDPSGMGPGLAAALITTLYGISVSRFVFYPIAHKLKQIAEMDRFREYFLMEGILMINEKRSAFYIQDRLNSYLQREPNADEIYQPALAAEKA